MDIEKIKARLKEVLQESTDNYVKGRDRVAFVILACPATSINPKQGFFLLEKWPGSDEIDLCYSPEETGYSDLGTRLGSVSMEYFDFEGAAHLIKVLYDWYLNFE